jgi:phenylpropionate dioxygenase-like ring-hydroxylating dioxygenase large terminal subunit
MRVTHNSTIDYDALVKRDRVHGRVYTDADIFEEEMEKIFHRGWVFVGHVGEVPNPGDFRLKRIGRQPVIMVRDEQGEVRLLLNRCRHRGSTVCQEERGNTRMFRCSYHGWSYRTSGELAGVPYPDAYGEDFRREEMGLVKVPRMAQYRGLVFGSLSPAGITLEEHLGLTREQIDLFAGFSEADEMVVNSGVHKYSYQGNWKLQIENSLDGYHAVTVHESFLDVLTQRAARRQAAADFKAQYSGGRFAVTRSLGGGHVMLDYSNRMYDAVNNDSIPEVRPTNESGREHFERLAKRLGPEVAAHGLMQGLTHVLIFPNLVLIGVQMRVTQPVAVGLTEVTLYPTTLTWLAPEVNTMRLRGHEAFFGPASFGGPDDADIFERVQAGLAAELDPWLHLGRGLHRERIDTDGTVIAERTDELNQRAILQHWKQVMTSAEIRRGLSLPRRTRGEHAAAPN